MDTLVDDPMAYADQDRAFHDTIMRTSGNRIARAVVRAFEKQVVNTARYVGEIRRDLCVASNNGHRNIYLRIAAHDPDGAARRCSPTSPKRGRYDAAAPANRFGCAADLPQVYGSLQIGPSG